MEREEPLVQYAGDHRKLICYRKAELIYDLTYHFANEVFLRGDRTVDQMVQAARSGKQNIVEGNAAKATSMHMCIHLLNVAKSSLQELLTDYEDFLRVRGHKRWEKDSEEVNAMRLLARQRTNAEICQLAATRQPEVVANMVLVLLHQNDRLLQKLIEKCSAQFEEQGGFREKMMRVRLAKRKQ